MLKQKFFLEKYYNNILERDALKNIYATENKDCEPLFFNVSWYIYNQ
jgi:hypothetical protein